MISRTHLVVLAVLVAAGFVIGALVYPSLPNPVPVHWDLYGRPNGFGPPWIDTLLVPAISALIALLLVVLPMIPRIGRSFQRFPGAYGRIGIVAVAMFFAIHCVILLKATNHPIRIERVLPVIIGIGIALMGNWMGKIRRNFFMGIRTPWTLRNDIVWERTHRVGGRLMVAYGLATAVASLFAAPLISIAIIVGGAIALVIWAIVYSYRVYRMVVHSPGAH